MHNSTLLSIVTWGVWVRLISASFPLEIEAMVSEENAWGLSYVVAEPMRTYMNLVPRSKRYPINLQYLHFISLSIPCWRRSQDKFVFVWQTCYAWRLSKFELFLSFFLELLEFSEDRQPWESVEEKLDAIRYELLASMIRPFVRPFFPPLLVITSLPAPVSIPHSLPPCLPPSSITRSVPHYHLLSFFAFHFPFSACLLPSVPRFPRPFPAPFVRPCLLFFTLLLALPFPYSTNSPIIFHSLTFSLFLTCVILVFFCFDNCYYFALFFRDMMRKIVKQMRTGRQWRAASQDGCS